ncbi:UDP-glucose--hexose-1-phosphate uridylyltransferase [Croceitalea sp. MTPC9]|uniref:UDP-glucose--hexose-1-phosphate uridylyltransferase n=1 Tax=unclassified Croceitalea TaxID=2632280 RepID=UPI002B3B3F9E|nr:UDP-glucose--hexose-1-phosphate uridylyltransferase [Croceitalea sp. MTPC6]GMN17617.1 UDP-glucose--hexose-1-phosphate uridylyltransferase [Croceitalea sp. MTPC9]
MNNDITKSLNKTHIRINILTGSQVLVSPHRTQRPWQGKQEDSPKDVQVEYDPECYLCPGNKRIGGDQNPDYSETYTFTNDFSALIPEMEDVTLDSGPFKARSEKGICRVVCFSPNHSLTLSQMRIDKIESVIETWRLEFRDLSKYKFINNVQIFENKGAMMGCSNPHPHGQIWAQQSIPLEIQIKGQNFSKYWKLNKHSILENYLKEELKLKRRVIINNKHYVVLVPFWAVWPFETMIVPKRAMKNITEISDSERKAFAEAISGITKIYDKLFNCSFPYSSGIHQAPVNGKKNMGWHWHMSFYPPLLRSATVKKFMVGYEMFGMPQRDITPEQAADTLNSLKE